MLRHAALTALVATAVLLSGCTFENGPGGQSAHAPGSLSYNGASSGSQSSTFDCDGSGKANHNTNLGSGGIRITVRDGADSVAYTKEVSGTGQSSRTEDVTGEPGEWTLTVDRMAGYSGQYNVNVQC